MNRRTDIPIPSPRIQPYLHYRNGQRNERSNNGAEESRRIIQQYNDRQSEGLRKGCAPCVELGEDEEAIFIEDRDRWKYRILFDPLNRNNNGAGANVGIIFDICHVVRLTTVRCSSTRALKHIHMYGNG